LAIASPLGFFRRVDWILISPVRFEAESIGIVDHGLVHAVEVNGGHAPDHRFDGAALDGTLGEVGGGEVLRAASRFRSFDWLAHDSPFSNEEAELHDGALTESIGVQLYISFGG
jgi:hypothetical protein